MLETGALTLTHKDTGRPFSRSNLEITFKFRGKTQRWTPGMKDRHNLKGTAKTLDGVNGDQTRKWIPVEKKDPAKPVLDQNKNGKFIWQGDMHTLPLCDGLVSRSGWAVVDDSASCVLDTKVCDWRPWVVERAPGERRDLYFLGYGLDFKDALRDAARVFGRQPLPPRFALGYWYSRYWAYTDKELKQLVEDFDNSLHHPLEKMGVDFWWMDWQQGKTGSQLPNLDTLPWINQLHWDDQVERRPRRRPINFSRFGGVGAGRMPVGFSGDTIVTWDSLAYQPYFTSTAANVLYGYWSHDIGGHMRGHPTPELYTRWIQFGVYSPILRTHTSKDIACERRIFHFPDPERTVMTNALRRRYELVPYIYGEMRKGAEDGTSIVRPMYHEHPGEEEAYRCPDQYMYGDAMIVAPVVSPMDPATGTSKVKVWLPKGKWFDTARGLTLNGGGWSTARYTLEEIPVFVRPGEVVPEQPSVTRLKGGSYPELAFRVYAGRSGEGVLYEDDGESTGWEDGDSATVTFRHTKKSGIRTFELAPAQGGFKGFKPLRNVTVIFEGMAPPNEVEGAGWTYDGDNAALVLALGKVDLRKGHTVRVKETSTASGFKGVMTRLEKARALNCQVSPARPIHAEERLAVRVAQTGNRVELRPQTWRTERKALERDLARLPTALREYAGIYRERGETFGAHAATLDTARGIVEATLKDFFSP